MSPCHNLNYIILHLLTPRVRYLIVTLLILSDTYLTYLTYLHTVAALERPPTPLLDMAPANFNPIFPPTEQPSQIPGRRLAVSGPNPKMRGWPNNSRSS